MKTRSIIVILATLIIGFIIGMLTSAQIRYHRLSPVRLYFSEERFREGFYKAIQPDDQQKAKIDLVLDKYARINSELQNNFRRDLDATMKEFRKELDQNLTKDQIARMKDLDERRQKMVRQFRGSHEGDSLSYRSQRHRFQDGGMSPREHQMRMEHDSSGISDKK
jgi:hypothetical protein